MLNPNCRSTAALIIALGAVTLASLLFITEGILDNSILHHKLLFTSVVAVAFLFPLLYIITGLKLSTVMAILSMTIVAAMCGLQYFDRVTYGVFFVDYKAITDKSLEPIKHLINQNPVSVLFYGKRKVYFDPCEIKNITEEDLKEFKDDILFRVHKRKSEEDYNIVKMDFSSLRVRNRGDELALGEMLNSFYFTKLKRKTILIFKVDNYLNLTNSGFDRPVFDDTEEGKMERKGDDIKKPTDNNKKEKESKKEDIEAKGVDSKKSTDDSKKSTDDKKKPADEKKKSTDEKKKSTDDSKKTTDENKTSKKDADNKKSTDENKTSKKDADNNKSDAESKKEENTKVDSNPEKESTKKTTNGPEEVESQKDGEDVKEKEIDNSNPNLKKNLKEEKEIDPNSANDLEKVENDVGKSNPENEKNENPEPAVSNNENPEPAVSNNENPTTSL